MSDDPMEVQRNHEKEMARIESRKAAFARSPFWFTVWYSITTLLNVACWLGFWFLLANCTCSGCITKGLAS